MRIERYRPCVANEWDDFVTRSKNGTFLFLRDYMDYHKDRFIDHSVMVRDESGALVALCPAHEDGECLSSHRGLTYGGFVVDETIKLPKMLSAFRAFMAYSRENGFSKILYKTIPHIYHRLPAEEDRYALFLCNASIARRAVLPVVYGGRRLPFQERRSRGERKARRAGVTVSETEDYPQFWDILVSRLRASHNTVPVHSLEEMQHLHRRFPAAIRLFAAFDGGAMLAGVLVYENPKVAHAQYIAASDQGRDVGALDLVFSELLSTHFKDKDVFDFGSADENDGRALNHGLIEQKEGFGARVVVHDHYILDLTAREASDALGDAL
jgi:hypothetical protein